MIPPLCKDCVAYAPSNLGEGFDTCHNPNLNPGASLVRGSSSERFCSVARSYEHLCGVEGKFFVKRERAAA